MTCGMPVTDDVLQCAREGDGRAWEELYRWLAPGLAGYLRVQGAPDPDDLTSEVFLTLVQRVDRFDGNVAQFRSFAFVVAHRRVQDDRRRRARAGERGTVGAVGHAPSADADDPVSREAAARVLRMCEDLTPDQRDVVLLRILGDLDLADTAAAVGKPIGAVKALQHRAFEQLRRKISAEAVSP